MRTSNFEQSGSDENAISIAMKPPRICRQGLHTTHTTQDLVYGYMFGYINKVQYTSKYHKQILSRCDPQQVVDDLLNLSPDPICCVLRSKQKSFCHRRVVAIGYPDHRHIQELNPPRKQPHARANRAQLDDFV